MFIHLLADIEMGVYQGEENQEQEETPKRKTALGKVSKQPKELTSALAKREGQTKPDLSVGARWMYMTGPR